MSDADERVGATAAELGIGDDLDHIEALCRDVADALADLDCAEAAVGAHLAARIVEDLQGRRLLLGSYRQFLSDVDDHLQTADDRIPLCPSKLRDARQLIWGVLEARRGEPIVRRERISRCARHHETVIGDCPDCIPGGSR
ncbi:hypothetical protein [Halostella sp. PRR32]|uniref:hypothetical protein n=1 Tax=Halostella sp. PRR32 TaxID=3098147 RepID=UPI002B1E31B5|nr:hypothetical protein [Halostella sp. PRR32]